MNTGLFCGLTGHDPDFETQCGNLEIDEQEAARIKQVEHDVKIEERNEAKKNKNYAKADEIRDELLQKGVKLIDTREGTTYEIM